MKKQLLNESEIRKLMKFANIGSLTNTFVEKLDESYFLNEQDPEEEPLEDVPPPPGGGEDLEGVEGAEGDIEDVDMMDDETEPVDENVLEGVKTAIEALKRGLEEMGLQEAADAITLEMTDEEEGEGEFGEEGEEEIPPEEGGVEMEPPPPGGEEEEEEVPAPPPMEENLMNEVMTRVVKRLRRATRRKRR